MCTYVHHLLNALFQIINIIMLSMIRDKKEQLRVMLTANTIIEIVTAADVDPVTKKPREKEVKVAEKKQESIYRYLTSFIAKQ